MFNFQPNPNISPITFINNLIGYMFGIIVIGAVIAFMYAAFLYLTSGGDDKKTGEARKLIFSAVIALIIAIFAKAIVLIVGNVVGVSLPMF